MAKTKKQPLPNPRPNTDPNFKEKVRRHRAMQKAYEARNNVDHARSSMITVNAILAELGGDNHRAIAAVGNARDALEHLHRELSLVISERQEAFDQVREPSDLIL